MVYLLASVCALANALSSIFERMGIESAPEERGPTTQFAGACPEAGDLAARAGDHCGVVSPAGGRIASWQPESGTTDSHGRIGVSCFSAGYVVSISHWSLGMVSCLAAAGGLAGFLVFAEPGGGDLVPTTLEWIVTASVCGERSS